MKTDCFLIHHKLLHRREHLSIHLKPWYIPITQETIFFFRIMNTHNFRFRIYNPFIWLIFHNSALLSFSLKYLTKISDLSKIFKPFLFYFITSCFNYSYNYSTCSSEYPLTSSRKFPSIGISYSFSMILNFEWSSVPADALRWHHTVLRRLTEKDCVVYTPKYSNMKHCFCFWSCKLDDRSGKQDRDDRAYAKCPTQ